MFFFIFCSFGANNNDIILHASTILHHYTIHHTPRLHQTPRFHHTPRFNHTPRFHHTPRSHHTSYSTSSIKLATTPPPPQLHPQQTGTVWRHSLRDEWSRGSSSARFPAKTPDTRRRFYGGGVQERKVRQHISQVRIKNSLSR